MDAISQQIKAYEEMREELEADHYREWVVLRNGRLTGTYPSFEDAADDAVRKYGRGPYLIRQVAAAPQRLPSLIQFGSNYAIG